MLLEYYINSSFCKEFSVFLEEKKSLLYLLKSTFYPTKLLKSTTVYLFENQWNHTERIFLLEIK